MMNILIPDLRLYWHVGFHKQSGQWILLSKNNANIVYRISELEAYALTYFTGQETSSSLKEKCQKHVDFILSDDFCTDLINKLIKLGIIEDIETENQELKTKDVAISPILKPEVELIEQEDGSFKLRNPQNLAYIQLDILSKEAIAQLGVVPPNDICENLGITKADLNHLVQILAQAEMLVGSKTPQPKASKWTPLKLLYVQRSLFNPDRLLIAPAQWLRWIWTKPFFFLLCSFLAGSLIFGLNHLTDLASTGNVLWQSQDGLLLIRFVLLVALVVTIHELGHALTLKHYGGEVRDMGLLFMFLIPAFYTDSTDSYRLPKKRQRTLVVAAGVICQCVMGAIAFWLWYFAVDNSWLKPTSYLFLVASLFTLVMNLNPMAKFDGYHLLVAMTGIDNLRDRSFQFYRDLFTKKSSHEPSKIHWVLLIYAPLSFVYILFIMGSMSRFVTFWILDNAGNIFIFLLIAWLIYYFFPRPNVHRS